MLIMTLGSVIISIYGQMLPLVILADSSVPTMAQLGTLLLWLGWFSYKIC